RKRRVTVHSAEPSVGERDATGLTFVLGHAPVLEVDFWELVKTSEPVPLAVMGLLALFSLLSWTIIFSKWAGFASATNRNLRFLRAFRKSGRLDAAAAAAEQYRGAPLVGVFDFGYSEVCRQVAARSTITNKLALERTLSLGASEE